MPGPAAPHDVRLRRHLAVPFPDPSWAAGFHMRTFLPADALALHTLLADVFQDGSDGPFESWWPRISGDDEFDPALCFLVSGPDGALVAAALCWSGAFVKDLAVRPDARGRGLGRALMLHAFAMFRQRGAERVDLKTNLVANTAAVQLYRALGMVAVDWEG